MSATTIQPGTRCGCRADSIDDGIRHAHALQGCGAYAVRMVTVPAGHVKAADYKGPINKRVPMCEPCAGAAEAVRTAAARLSCDGRTRTGESEMGQLVTRPCGRDARHVATRPMAEGFKLLCDFHASAAKRKGYIVEPLSAAALSRGGRS